MNELKTKPGLKEEAEGAHRGCYPSPGAGSEIHILSAPRNQQSAHLASYLEVVSYCTKAPGWAEQAQVPEGCHFRSGELGGAPPWPRVPGTGGDATLVQEIGCRRIPLGQEGHHFGPEEGK